ncbi:D-hexose-6-phosphate mutarotase [Salinicola sp. RZ23]|uniref:D-hexose-6-phosphate mutarotase n=1 Tax=Salinicola sp. RZ23 TaxID=1949087 RepID=UPI000DA26516|nr:D-hexose-6-phosphate mutarotase [Salinicola sp. RZ23]
MIPDTLADLIAATDGQRETTWEGRRVLLINADWGQLALSLQGAQLLHFLPFPPDAAGDRPVPDPQDGWLWVTPTPQALPGAIRGGIPLCWPWFADESPDGKGPMHGPARTAEWRLDAVDEDISGSGVEIHLSPQERLHDELTPNVVVHANAHKLSVELFTRHTGTTPVKLTGALHTYFAVADTHRCRVEGLAGARYLDKLERFAEKQQQGELGIRGALDRIYQSNRPVVLDDGQRRLLITKQGSDSTVVWHPGEGLPGDTPAEVGQRFLCVEAACTRVDPVWLVPDGQHLLATTIVKASDHD